MEINILPWGNIVKKKHTFTILRKIGAAKICPFIRHAFLKECKESTFPRNFVLHERKNHRCRIVVQLDLFQSSGILFDRRKMAGRIRPSIRWSIRSYFVRMVEIGDSMPGIRTDSASGPANCILFDAKGHRQSRVVKSILGLVSIPLPESSLFRSVLAYLYEAMSVRPSVVP